MGSGIAGLAAAHVLQRGGRRVTLFEADARLGGHAHTHALPAEADGTGTAMVDSGFIVHNRRTYPNLLRLFAELGVATRPSEMSMSVSCAGCGLEYAGARGAAGLLPGLRSRNPGSYLRMLAEVPVFGRAARRLLEAAPRQRTGVPAAAPGEPTLGGFAAAARLSGYFTAHYLVPLVSAVWSCPPGTALRYPARYLFAFLDHHGMLEPAGSPRWRTVEGGSARYVDAVAARLHRVRPSSRVEAVRRTAGGVRVRAAGRPAEEFAAAVVAAHPGQALALLERPTRAQREVLGAFRYSRNEAVLHADPGVMPRDRRAWASWNHRLPSCSPDGGPVQVSYHMNRLQRLPGSRPHFVTLNAAPGTVPEGRTAARMVYEHPVYTPETLAAQRRLPEADDGPIVLAGAYHGWGFHEDGCRSGAAAAARLGVRW
ncbi:NAD(P)/FAD-dependent oxidoreductase [Nocardiopsis sp. CNT-189]|uniref:NAD(P)/FAD-dependent oxidoreductase n=1 Tax=Nocardiopsis oceanisediminis TaxID=2816862 RepID=UPI003B3B1C6D